MASGLRLAPERAINARFHFASVPEELRLGTNPNSLVHSSIGTPSPLKEAPTPCEQDGFRFYFTGITSLLFTFPSRYWFTIGEIKYLALAGSPACFPPGYLGPMVLKKNIKERKGVFKYRTVTFSGIPFQGISFNQPLPKCSPSETFVLRTNTPDDIPLQPLLLKNNRFGLFPVRSPLLRE